MLLSNSRRVFVSEKNLYQASVSDRLAQRLRTDKRRELRHSIALRVRVAGSDRRKEPWSELAETVNVSTGGLALRLSPKVMIGEILFVELALPARFQRDIKPSATHNTYARVRYIEMHEGQQIVRLEFLRTPTPSQTLLTSVKF
jgi:PilZ domain-containing protein